MADKAGSRLVLERRRLEEPVAAAARSVSFIFERLTLERMLMAVSARAVRAVLEVLALLRTVSMAGPRLSINSR